MNGHSDMIAEALRQEQAPLDDVTRARIERRLVEAWELKRASRRISTGERAPAAAVPRIWAASMAAFVFVALLVVLFEVANDRRLSEPDPVQMAHFELRVGDAAVQTGVVGEGQTLETGKYGSIDVTASASRVLIFPNSRVRFDRISSDDVHLSLVVGKVEVTFHPIRYGEQSIAVETRVASVQAVGTRFSVEVDPRGDTSIDVTEGVVSVTSSSGNRSAKNVAAGERVRIGADGREKRAPMPVGADRTLIANETGVPSAVAEESAQVDEPPEAPAASLPSEEKPQTSHPQVRRAKLQTGREQADPLKVARLMIWMKQYAAARDRLRRIATGSADSGTRAAAYTLIAESYLAEGYLPRAADSYNDAARVAPDEPVSRNAVFSLARLLEYYVKDNQAAVSAYRRYLRESPRGKYRQQAYEALCRLGDNASCAADRAR